MKNLLDTHTLLWAIQETKKLSSNVIELLESPEDALFASAINYREICIKVEKGKLYLEGFTPGEVPKLVERMGFSSLDLNQHDASSFFSLCSDFHRDPFDRMIIRQAINNQYTLLTNDPEKKNEAIGLKTYW